MITQQRASDGKQAASVEGESRERALDGRQAGNHSLQHVLGNAALASLLVRQRTPGTMLQRACCTGCAAGGNCTQEFPTVFRSPSGAGPAGAATVPEGSTSEPLAAPLRNDMESAFAAPLGSVRIHRDGDAARAASAMRAKAFTVGQDIYFGAGFYAPESSDGRRLLAHELAHTLQQPVGGGYGRKALNISEPGDVFEREADAAADRVMAGAQPSIERSAGAPGVQADLLDSVGDALGGAYDSAASTASSIGEAVSNTASAVATTVENIAGDVASQAASTVSSTVAATQTAVNQAVDTAVSTASAAASTVVDKATALVKLASLKSQYEGMAARAQAPGRPIVPTESQRLKLNAAIVNANASPALAAAGVETFPELVEDTPISLLIPAIGTALTAIAAALDVLADAALIIAAIALILLILVALIDIVGKAVDAIEDAQDKEKQKEKEKERAKEKEKEKEKEDEEEKKREEEDEEEQGGIPCPAVNSGLFEFENQVFTGIEIIQMANLFTAFKREQYELRNGPGTYCQALDQILADRTQFFFAVDRTMQVCSLTVCAPHPRFPSGEMIAKGYGVKPIGEVGAVHAELRALPQLEVQLAAVDIRKRTGALLVSTCVDLACDKSEDGCVTQLMTFVYANLPGGFLQSLSSRDRASMQTQCDAAFNDAVMRFCR